MSLCPKGYTHVGEKGDLSLYVTHVQFEEDNTPHTALYIRNEKRTNARGGCPVVLIPLRNFWEFRPEDRDRGKFHKYADMNTKLAGYANALYGDATAANIFRIHDAILEFADDVKNLPPPAEKTRAEWENELDRCGFKLRINGERVI